jgi:hypothetical protein
MKSDPHPDRRTFLKLASASLGLAALPASTRAAEPVDPDDLATTADPGPEVMNRVAAFLVASPDWELAEAVPPKSPATISGPT